MSREGVRACPAALRRAGLVQPRLVRTLSKTATSMHRDAYEIAAYLPTSLDAA